MLSWTVLWSSWPPSTPLPASKPSPRAANPQEPGTTVTRRLPCLGSRRVTVLLWPTSATADDRPRGVARSVVVVGVLELLHILRQGGIVLGLPVP